MRRFALLFCLAALLVAPGFAQDANTPVPKILIAGFDAYKMGGPGEALRAWLRGSPNEAGPEATAQFAVLRSAQELYGPYRGFEVVAARQVSPSTRIVYMTVDYDKGPLFAKFLLYRAEPQGWIVTNLLFSTNDTEVLPLQ
ncbi:MAG TPA: hypothetical protein VHX60_01650 [Acidobacteriaceae bacterium]|jgi:hypothetical protein|nr:hypothetical protein [Acidobacteriaceae bacterium]